MIDDRLIFWLLTLIFGVICWVGIFKFGQYYIWPLFVP